jgi:DnaK suppressor protein
MPPTIDPAPATIWSVAADADEHLDAGRLDVVRAELQQQRRFRTSQLVELAADTAEAVAGGDEPRLQVTRVLAASAQTALAEIEAAMDRLADGSYGYCERCQEQIPAGRLQVLPTSRLCTGCQYLIESGRLNADRRDRSWLTGGRR